MLQLHMLRVIVKTSMHFSLAATSKAAYVFDANGLARGATRIFGQLSERGQGGNVRVNERCLVHLQR